MRPRRSVVVLAAVGAFTLVGCGSPELPPLAGSSTPEVVVATYLAAAQKDDEDTMRALATPEHAGQGLGLGGGAVSISELTIEPAVERTTAENDSTGYSLASGHDEAVDLDTTFDLRGGDMSMPDGATTWSFLLVRDAGGPWLIAGEGHA